MSERLIVTTGLADKHRPLEMSAKVRVPFLRQVVPINKKVARDPRFDDLSGEYNAEVFDKTCQFLNDIRAKEKELVKKQLKKRHSGKEHEKLQGLLTGPRFHMYHMIFKTFTNYVSVERLSNFDYY